jgi:hypothetical protein
MKKRRANPKNAGVPDATLLTAKDVRGPSALVEIDGEPPPRLIVDPPLPVPLAQGRVFIQYRTENLRVVPVFGVGASGVSPRIGHVHITVDDAPWHFIDASGETVVVVGLSPGPHKVLVQLANPIHQIIDSHMVRFRIRRKRSVAAPALNRPSKT